MSDEKTDQAIEAKQALEFFRAGDPDEVPQVRVRSAYRDLSCKGSGPECYRKFIYPGSTEPQWGDERLCAAGIRAAERRASVGQEVPVGTLVLDYERQRYKFQKGKCAFVCGIVGRNAEGKAKIYWLEHRTLRKRPVYEVTLPDGNTIDIERR